MPRRSVGATASFDNARSSWRVSKNRARSWRCMSVSGSAGPAGFVGDSVTLSGLWSDDFFSVYSGEMASSCSDGLTSRCITPLSTTSVQRDMLGDIELEQQTQEVFASMEYLIADVLRDVCFCACHAVYGYDLDVVRLRVEDICVECDCYVERLVSPFFSFLLLFI